MKTKTLLFTFSVILCSFISATAQELLISEDFSSAAWQTEFARLNPGGGLNPNATNPNAYVTPANTGWNGSYTPVNSIDLYFGKYKLNGGVESLPVTPCALPDITHVNGDAAVAFRLFNNAEGRIEFPEVSSAGTITIHIRNGNETTATSVGLEMLSNNAWIPLKTFSLKPWNAYTTRDEVLSFDINSASPVKLRLINNTSATKRYMDLYRVDISSYITTDVKIVSSNLLKVIGRKLISTKPTKIELFNTVGVSLFKTQIESEIELPSSLDSGVYLLKSDFGLQKIFFSK